MNCTFRQINTFLRIPVICSTSGCLFCVLDIYQDLESATTFLARQLRNNSERLHCVRPIHTKLKANAKAKRFPHLDDGWFQ